MDLTTDELRENALQWDQNIRRLEIIIESVNKAIKNFYQYEYALDWSGILDAKEECEAIYRLAILAFENYIHSTIRIYFEEENEYSKFYKLEQDIDLIIILAKHITSSENKDSLLNKFNLNVNDFPIYHGIIVLNKNRDLDEIVETLKKWTAKLIHIKYPISGSF